MKMKPSPMGLGPCNERHKRGWLLSLSGLHHVRIQDNSHLHTTKWFLTRHQISQHLDFTLPCLQIWEKQIFVVSATHSVVYLL